MSKIINGGLDQYGAGPFEQQQFGTAGVEGVNESELSAYACTTLTALVATRKWFFTRDSYALIYNTVCFLRQRDYVAFGSLLSVVCNKVRALYSGS